MSKVSRFIVVVLVAVASAVFVMHNSRLMANAPDLSTPGPEQTRSSGVDLERLPRAVRKTIKREAFGGRIIEVEKETDDGKSYYEAEVVIGSYIYDVAVNEKGILLAKVMARPLGSDDGDDDDGDDENGDDDDVSITMGQLPKAVRKTLKRETRGGEIEELEKETEDGKVIYSAEVEYETDSGELVYEIEISKDGILLHKILESIEHDPDDEDDEDEDDDDDDDEPVL